MIEYIIEYCKVVTSLSPNIVVGLFEFSEILQID